MAAPDPTADDVLTLRPSKRKWVLVTLGCATFTVLGGTLVSSGELWIGVLSIAFFGPGALLGAWTLAPGTSYLRLDPEGIVAKTPLRTQRHAWDEVDNFRVFEVHTRHSTTHHVGFDLRDPPARGATLRRLNRKLAYPEAGLPDTYGRRPEDLVQLLEVYRDRYAGASAS